MRDLHKLLQNEYLLYCADLHDCNRYEILDPSEWFVKIFLPELDLHLYNQYGQGVEMRKPVQYREMYTEYTIDYNTTVKDLKSIVEEFCDRELEWTFYTNGAIISTTHKQQLMTDAEFDKAKLNYKLYRKQKLEEEIEELTSQSQEQK